MTMSLIVPATTCGTRSTRPSCAVSSAGRPRTVTSSRAWPQPSTGTGPTNHGGRHPKTPPKPSTQEKASERNLRQAASADRDDDPGAGAFRPAGARRFTWLVQRKLAAREDDRAGSGRLRSCAEQHLL